MSTGKLKANKDWLVWARKSVHLDKKEVAKKMRIKEETFNNIECTGELKYSQLLRLSEIYKLSPHLFFNAKNPIYEKDIADFRTENNKQLEITSDIIFELRNAKSKRQTLLNIEKEDEDFRVSDFKFKDSVCDNDDEAINIILDELEMSNAKRELFSLNDWISKIEKLGILVFQFYGISPKKLRGYAIYYDKLPIIGINHQEKKEEAMKFTLFHELAHLLLKKEGLSNLSSYYPKDAIEVRCNHITGEVLVPSKDIRNIVKTKNITDFTDYNVIKYLAKRYNVSNEVIVRKFLNEKYIKPKDYEAYKNEFNKFIFPEHSKKTEQSKNKDKSEDVNVSSTQENKSKNNQRLAQKCITENGEYYINLLIQAYENEIITDLDLARNLDVSLSIVDIIIQKINKGGSMIWIMQNMLLTPLFFFVENLEMHMKKQHFQFIGKILIIQLKRES